jgi:hypothetical protein
MPASTEKFRARKKNAKLADATGVRFWDRRFLHGRARQPIGVKAGRTR